MLKRQRFSQVVVFVLTILVFQIVVILHAQAECEALVTNGFNSLAETCSDLSGNSACTSDSGEVTPINDIESLSATITDDMMQLATLNVSANVPLALSETGMRLFLIGDTTLENAVDPAIALDPSSGAVVSTLVGANIRSIPSADGRLVTTAAVGTELIADGLSSDSQWVHVLTDEGTGWISRQIIAVVDGELDSLPIITDGTRTLWQDVFLSTSSGNNGCGDTFPSMLYIQGPDNITTTMTVNNITLRINSDIVLSIDDNNIMKLYTIEGVAIGDGISVPAGFTMSIQLSQDGRDRNGSWTNLRPIDDTERDFLTGLQLLPESLLYRPVEIPSQTEVSELLALINQASTGAGQTVVTAAGQGKVDCSGFQPTFPLDFVTPGATAFYWDGAPGAQTYRINFFDASGVFLGNVSVDALSPTFSVDPGSIVGDRGQFAWAVDALVGGELACTTGQAIVQRIAGSNPQPIGDTDDDEGSSSNPKPKATKCKWNQC